MTTKTPQPATAPTVPDTGKQTSLPGVKASAKIKRTPPPTIAFTVMRDSFREALKAARRSSLPSSSLEILHTARITADARKKTVVLAATNLETATVATVGARAIKSGEVCIDANRLWEIVVNWPGETMRFEPFIPGDDEEDEANIGNIQITGDGNAVYRVCSESAESFPALPAPSADAPTARIARDEFARVVSRVIKATATDMSRPVLNGIRFHLLGNGTFDVAATDAFRLHLASGDISYEGEPLDFIWPLESLKTAVALFKSGEQSGLLEIKLPQATAKDEQGKATSWRPLQVEADGIRFLTRLVDGLFPNFDAVIPKRRIGSVLLDTVAALQAIKVVEVMARDTGSVTCAVGEAVTDAEGTSFTLSGHSADAGWSENVLTVTADGDPLTFRVAGHFLADALKAAPEPPLLLSYNSPQEPVVLTASAEPDFKAVIMPMHVSR